jgi:hypothetical protein
MNPPVDLEHVVTAWLRDQASASGSDRVLAAALSRASTARQERRRPTWLHLPRSSAQQASMLVAATVVIAVASFAVLSAGRDTGPRSIVGSTPAPPPSQSPKQTEPGYPPAVMGEIRPGERHSLTVDGVPLSFSVPTGGWFPGMTERAVDGTFEAGSLYIAKNTAGGQRAEAVVFWTAWPGGVNAGPCHILLSQPIGQSAADLAAVVATAPGIDLVAGPSDVTLGGHEAKYVALTVHEHLGCDPGYFFTWPDDCRGDCWIRTQVGDRIGVWVVKVNETRLVIEAETTRQGIWLKDPDGTLRFDEWKTELTDAELQQEVELIVESIRFE